MSQDHDSSMKHSADSSPSTDGLTAAQAGRRRLLQGGLAAAPVVLSVTSRPVMATTGSCTTASAFGSINASRPAKVTACGGCKPDYWKDPLNHSKWPSPHCATKTTLSTDKLYFRDVFGNNTKIPYAATLLQVLQSTAVTGDYAVAKFCVAAVLNASSGLTPASVLSVQTAKDVWAAYVARNYFEPTAGIRWYADSSTPSGTGSILQWLGSTMPN